MRVYCGLLLSYSRRFKILRTAYLSSLASNDHENLDNDFSTLTSIHPRTDLNDIQVLNNFCESYGNGARCSKLSDREFFSSALVTLPV